jgi:hypothetical protein
VVLHDGNRVRLRQLGLGQRAPQQTHRHVQRQPGSFFLSRCRVRVTNRCASPTKLM